MKRTRSVAAAVSGGMLVLGLAACSTDSSATTSSTTSPAAPAASASPTPAAMVPSLSGKMTEVTLDPTFVKGLTALKLTPAPVGKATIKNGVASFPITGGSVTYYTPGTVTPFVQGSIEHAGSGLSLTGGGIKVELTDFVVDPGSSMLTGKVTANGKVAAQSAPLFFLDGRTLKPLQANSDGTAVLEGTKVSLTKEAAALLNKTYKVNALTEFFPVGVAKITINTQ